MIDKCWRILFTTFTYAHITNDINLVKKKTAKVKNIDSTMNATSVYFFANTASIICSSIHIFYLYMNSICWSCINDTIDIFSFYQIYTYPHNVMRKRRTIIISETFDMHITASLSLTYRSFSSVMLIYNVYCSPYCTEHTHDTIEDFTIVN